MLEQFVGMTDEWQIRMKYSALSDTDKEQFQKELLPFMNMMAKTMLAAGVFEKEKELVDKQDKT